MYNAKVVRNRKNTIKPVFLSFAVEDGFLEKRYYDTFLEKWLEVGYPTSELSGGVYLIDIRDVLDTVGESGVWGLKLGRHIPKEVIKAAETLRERLGV